MLFLIIEHFKNGDPIPVYQRAREQGRMTPPGVEYINSWVTADLKRCYQIMECRDARLLVEWMSLWADIVDFEMMAIVTSAEAAIRAQAREDSRTVS
jgi:hypothetical protein